MDRGSTRISRAELYEQVWSVPMVKLAKRYGLSDVGLAKICKKYRIPRPPRGYWARKYAGIKDKRIPLPDGDADQIIEISSSPFNSCQGMVREVALKEISSEREKEKQIVVPQSLRNPHPLVRQSTAILETLVPNSIGLLEPPKERCLDICVSRKTLRRALRIMDALIKGLEERGYAVSFSAGSTEVSVLEMPVGFGIKEQLATRKTEPKDHDLKGHYHFGHSRLIEERVPSGDLCLTIHYPGWGVRQNWRDKSSRRLEDSLNSFVTGLVRVAAHKRERICRQEEEERKRREWLQRQEEEKRILAERRRRIQEEQDRVSKLIQDAENWHKSRIIREYIVAVKEMISDGKCPFHPDGNLDDWLRWARAQADRLDPLAPSPPSILDEDIPD